MLLAWLDQTFACANLPFWVDGVVWLGYVSLMGTETQVPVVVLIVTDGRSILYTGTDYLTVKAAAQVLANMREANNHGATTHFVIEQWVGGNTDFRMDTHVYGKA